MNSISSSSSSSSFLGVIDKTLASINPIIYLVKTKAVDKSVASDLELGKFESTQTSIGFDQLNSGIIELDRITDNESDNYNKTHTGKKSVTSSKNDNLLISSDSILNVQETHYKQKPPPYTLLQNIPILADSDEEDNTQSIDQIDTHKGIHNEECIYQYEICKKRYKPATAVKPRQLSHADDMPYQCEICNERYKTIHAITQHELLSHFTGKLYKCTLCVKVFKYKFNLNRHIKKHNNDQSERYRCLICGKNIINKYNFNMHVRIHTRKNLHKCELCEYEFIQKGNLKTHMKQHVDQKSSYKCDLCMKDFAYVSDLSEHRLIHSDNKNF